MSITNCLRNESNKDIFVIDSTDTKDAWGKIDAFFAKTLAAGSGAVAVEPIGKLTISWGEIKAKNGPDHDGNIPPKGKLINRIPKTPFFDGHSSH